MDDAEHEETSQGAPTLLVSRLACSLAGKAQTICLMPHSLVHRAYGQEKVTEQFACSYGLNPQFRRLFENGQLKITGADPDGEAMVAEIPDHPFYVGTLFVPQASSDPANPHPLILAFLKAARAFQTNKNH